MAALFGSLQEKLNHVFSKLTKHGRLTELEIKQAMREIRIALLEADVNILVAKNFINKVSEKAVGQEILNVKEIKACFVVGRISDTTIGISARSDGTVNVQKIMESMNGGGHFSSAATQLEEVNIEDAKKMLYSKLESFVGDTRIE